MSRRVLDACLLCALASVVVAHAQADDTAPERAWFVALKTELGKTAKLGHYDDYEGQVLLRFEDSDKPKDKKFLLAPPSAFLEHTTCAPSPPDPSKALASEEGWWLFDSETRSPVALQLSFEGAAFWRYDATQSCLIRWVVPEPVACQYTEGDSPEQQPTISANPKTSPLPCEAPALVSAVKAEFTSDEYRQYVENHKKAVASGDASQHQPWDENMAALPVISEGGETNDQSFYLSVSKSGFVIKQPDTKDATFSYDEIQIPYKKDSDDKITFSASIWKRPEGTITLHISKEYEYFKGLHTRNPDSDVQHMNAASAHRWDPARKRFALVWRNTLESNVFPDEPRSESTARSDHSFPLNALTSIAYHTKISHKGVSFTTECYDDDLDGMKDCQAVTTSTRHSREIQWTININGHDLELMTLKPKAITTKK